VTRLDHQGSIIWNGNEGIFSLPHYIQTCSGVYPASYPMGTRDKVPGHKADHKPPSNAEVKNTWNQYLHFPMSSWHDA